MPNRWLLTMDFPTRDKHEKERMRQDPDACGLVQEYGADGVARHKESGMLVGLQFKD